MLHFDKVPARRRAMMLRAERKRLMAAIGEAKADADQPGDYRVIARLEAELANVNAALRETRKRAA